MERPPLRAGAFLPTCLLTGDQTLVEDGELDRLLSVDPDVLVGDVLDREGLGVEDPEGVLWVEELVHLSPCSEELDAPMTLSTKGWSLPLTKA
jgi:hypothetical protein